ncbi:MAG: hypothetical protein V1827_06345 [Candidatus Micrarchaeota archaeon]
MAEKGIDTRKVLMASFLIIGIGIVLSIISIILQLLSLTLTEQMGDTISLIASVYLLLMFPVFFVLFFWTGIRAAKSYGFDAVGAGIVAAFSFFVIGLVERLLNLLLAVIVVKGPLDAVGFGSTEMIVASSIFGGLMGLSGVALSTVCGFGMLIFGTAINFVVGGVGAIFALGRQ